MFPNYSFSFSYSFSNNFSHRNHTVFNLHKDVTALRNEHFIKRANNLSNSLCHKLSKERDAILLERGSLNTGETSLEEEEEENPWPFS